MYLDSPFHSNQAAAKERTYRETDGPALNTRHNSLEGLRVREGDGMSKLQINTPIEFSLVFTAKPCCKYCNIYYTMNIFSLTQKGKILESFFSSCCNGKAAPESVMGMMMTVSKANSSHPRLPINAVSIRIHYENKRIFFSLCSATGLPGCKGIFRLR